MENFDKVGDGQKAAAFRVQLPHHPRTVLLVPQSCEHPLRDSLEEVVVLRRGTLKKDTLRLALSPGHELVRVYNISHVSARAPHAWARHAVQSIDDGVGVCADEVALGFAAHVAGVRFWARVQRSCIHLPLRHPLRRTVPPVCLGVMAAWCAPQYSSSLPARAFWIAQIVTSCVAAARSRRGLVDVLEARCRVADEPHGLAVRSQLEP